MQQWKQEKNGQHESREEDEIKLSEWLKCPVNKKRTLINEIAVHLRAIFAYYILHLMPQLAKMFVAVQVMFIL